MGALLKNATFREEGSRKKRSFRSFEKHHLPQNKLFRKTKEHQRKCAGYRPAIYIWIYILYTFFWIFLLCQRHFSCRIWKVSPRAMGSDTILYMNNKNWRQTWRNWRQTWRKQGKPPIQLFFFFFLKIYNCNWLYNTLGIGIGIGMGMGIWMQKDIYIYTYTHIYRSDAEVILESQLSSHFT